MFSNHKLFKNKQLYRSGLIQNIKIFKPQKNITQNTYISHDINKIYATDDISFAAGFCFTWSDQEGFSFGSNNRYSGPWILKVPEKYKDRLNNKCSMYVIDGTNFTKVKGDIPEYISTESAKVLKEVKFNTCWDCLKKYKVIVNIV
jgi:hypothetical protein